MDDISYTYHDLLHIYIQTRRGDHIHSDFKDYYAKLLELLGPLFEVDFSAASPSRGPLWMLFYSAVNSYLSLRTPWSNFLEAGLIVQKIKQLGPQGEQIFQLSEQIEDATRRSREAHLQLLDELFISIYGSRDLVVTSQDLKARGFDDTKKPQIEDYW